MANPWKSLDEKSMRDEDLGEEPMDEDVDGV